MKILVAHFSKTGFTKGMAESIGEKLRGRGLQAEVQEVSSVCNAGDYDACVIGSAVYMFHWAKEAKRFVSRNRTLLSGIAISPTAFAGLVLPVVFLFILIPRRERCFGRE